MFLPNPLSSPRLRLHCALILLLCLAGWPGGIVTEARADLFVSSFITDEVKRYDGSTGAFIGNFASGGGLDGPSGLVFTPEAVPESATLALLALGLAALGWNRRRRGPEQ